MIKYLISVLTLIYLVSCNETFKNKNESIANKSIEKIKNINETEENKNSNKKITPLKNSNIIFYHVGEPYFIEGVKYTPEENYNYKEIGLASFYGKELHNVKTINNELNKVTELLGRHKTLPLPSMVKITNLENGYSINVKIVDRHDDNASLIQVSRKVAQLLGFYRSKIATVKVEILSDASKQWKSVTLSLNEPNFDETVSSAPTDIVSIEEIDEINVNNIGKDKKIDVPIELETEKVVEHKLYLKVSGFESYDSIKVSINEFDDNLKYTSEKNSNLYDLIIGPIENTLANKLVSHFISKGYKETEILLK